MSIGKFCSIAPEVTFILGGEHRSDWCTTYPFNCIINDFKFIKGHPRPKGEIVVGNDVWLAWGCKILSGVHIGNGSIIASGAVVTKDVEPYSIVGGVPAKEIQKRFDEKTIQKLEEMQWWDWDKEYIYDAVTLLQNESMDELYEYYNSVVKKKV